MISETENKFYLKEKNDSRRKRKLVLGYPVPDFNLGLEYLGIAVPKTKKELMKKTDAFVRDWFENINKNFQIDREIKVREKGNFLEFPSILDDSQMARFHFNFQPKESPGGKVAIIHVMHWDGKLKDYERLIALIRKTGLPISTLIYVPAGRGLNPGKDSPADFESVSPNIGKTIFKSRQYINDIQFMGKYLKKEKGFEQVGLFSYSLGSMYGAIASMTQKNLFDFGIFHMMADDFSEAVASGVATDHIAKKIENKIDAKILKKLWSVISPGAYQENIAALPKHTRIIQCDYDYVFGIDNVTRFNRKLKKFKPDAELETVPANHLGLSGFPVGIEVMWRNLKFIYKKTEMKNCKRSIIFR